MLPADTLAAPAGRFAVQPLIAHRPTAVLGHRGLRGPVRENTIEAFALAADAGADGVELDVRRTRDGALVIHHDAVVDGVLLANVDGAEVVARWPWLPTLEQALDGCRGLLVNIEIKNDPSDPDYDPDDRAAAAVAELVAARDIYQQTIVSSFHPPTVTRLRQLDPRLRTGQLLGDVGDPVAALDSVVAAGHQAIHPWVGSLTGDTAGALVAAAHSAGIWVLVWTVNDPADLRHLAAAGVDGVIVDDPAAAVALLGS